MKINKSVIKKQMKYSDWLGFDNVISAENFGNETKFYNFFTKRYEAYDYITAQEVLLMKYDIILIDMDEVRTKKQRLLSILESADITSKKGQKNMKKFFDKYEEYSGKIDDMFEKVDKGFGKMDKAFDSFEKKTTSTSSKKSKKKETEIESLDFKLWK